MTKLIIPTPTQEMLTELSNLIPQFQIQKKFSQIPTKHNHPLLNNPKSSLQELIIEKISKLNFFSTNEEIILKTREIKTSLNEVKNLFPASSTNPDGIKLKEIDSCVNFVNSLMVSYLSFLRDYVNSSFTTTIQPIEEQEPTESQKIFYDTQKQLYNSWIETKYNKNHDDKPNPKLKTLTKFLNFTQEQKNIEYDYFHTYNAKNISTQTAQLQSQLASLGFNLKLWAKDPSLSAKKHSETAHFLYLQSNPHENQIINVLKEKLLFFYKTNTLGAIFVPAVSDKFSNLSLRETKEYNNHIAYDFLGENLNITPENYTNFLKKQNITFEELFINQTTHQLNEKFAKLIFNILNKKHNHPTQQQKNLYRLLNCIFVNSKPTLEAIYEAYNNLSNHLITTNTFPYTENDWQVAFKGNPNLSKIISENETLSKSHCLTIKKFSQANQFSKIKNILITPDELQKETDNILKVITENIEVNTDDYPMKIIVSTPNKKKSIIFNSAQSISQLDATYSSNSTNPDVFQIIYNSQPHSKITNYFGDVPFLKSLKKNFSEKLKSIWKYEQTIEGRGPEAGFLGWGKNNGYGRLKLYSTREFNSLNQTLLLNTILNTSLPNFQQLNNIQNQLEYFDQASTSLVPQTFFHQQLHEQTIEQTKSLERQYASAIASGSSTFSEAITKLSETKQSQDELITNLQDNLNDLSKKHKDLSSKQTQIISNTKKEINALWENEEKTGKYDILNKEHKDLSSKQTQIISNTEDKINALWENEEKTGKYDILKQEYSNYQKNHKNPKINLSEYVTKQTHKTLEKQLKKQQNQNAELEKNISTQTLEHQKQLTEYEISINSLKAEKTSIQEELEQSTKDLENLETMINTLANTMEGTSISSEQAIKNFKNKFGKQKAEILKLHKNYTEQRRLLLQNLAQPTSPAVIEGYIKEINKLLLTIDKQREQINNPDYTNIPENKIKQSEIYLQLQLELECSRTISDKQQEDFFAFRDARDLRETQIISSTEDKINALWENEEKTGKYDILNKEHKDLSSKQTQIISNTKKEINALWENEEKTGKYDILDKKYEDLSSKQTQIISNTEDKINALWENEEKTGKYDMMYEKYFNELQLKFHAQQQLLKQADNFFATIIKLKQQTEKFCQNLTNIEIEKQKTIIEQLNNTIEEFKLQELNSINNQETINNAFLGYISPQDHQQQINDALQNQLNNIQFLEQTQKDLELEKSNLEKQLQDANIFKTRIEELEKENKRLKKRQFYLNNEEAWQKIFTNWASPEHKKWVPDWTKTSINWWKEHTCDKKIAFLQTQITKESWNYTLKYKVIQITQAHVFPVFMGGLIFSPYFLFNLFKTGGNPLSALGLTICGFLPNSWNTAKLKMEQKAYELKKQAEINNIKLEQQQALQNAITRNKQITDLEHQKQLDNIKKEYEEKLNKLKSQPKSLKETKPTEKIVTTPENKE
jgi:hypothetical protein